MYKKFRQAVFFTALFAASAASAQDDRPVTIKVVPNADRSLDFQYQKNVPGTHTVVVTFDDLRNTHDSDKQIITLAAPSGKAFSLRPSSPNQSIQFNTYRVSVLRGKFKPRYDAGFKYILPYETGSTVKAFESPFVGQKYFGNTTPDDWKAYSFQTKREDTVIAMRKGTVVEVKDAFDTDTPSDAVFTTSRNGVLVEHEDGTMARYSGFKKGILVTPGTTVYPGTPLGLNMKSNKTSTNYSIGVYVYYLKSTDIEANKGKTLATEKTLYGFITPHFFTQTEQDAILKDRTEYISSSNADIVRLEMTKKELKKLK